MVNEINKNFDEFKFGLIFRKMCVYTSIDCGNFIPQHSGDCLACVAGVRKGRGRELGPETPSPFNACTQARDYLTFWAITSTPKTNNKRLKVARLDFFGLIPPKFEH